MFMGYLTLTCPTCDRKLRHHVRDLKIKQSRICPDCGTLIKIEDNPPQGEGHNFS